jgi:peptidoglycan/LPS O-acetylase OafA/YrhL
MELVCGLLSTYFDTIPERMQQSTGRNTLNTHKNKIAFANTLRGLAALFVVISHYFSFFWLARSTVSIMTNMPELPQEKFPKPWFVDMVNIGHGFTWGPYGVSIFFLISGFVIPFSLKSYSAKDFLINRILRIYPTYMVGFSLTLLFIYIGGSYFGNEWKLTASESIIHLFPGLRDLLWQRNLDGIVWTLEVELKFYLICLLAIQLFKKQSLIIFILPFAIAAISYKLYPLLPGFFTKNIEAFKQAKNFINASPYIAFMFIGVAFHYLHTGRINKLKAAGLIGSIFGVAAFTGVVLSRTNDYYSGLINIIYSYGYGLITFSVAFIFPRFFRGNRVLDFFAKISYPLYVVHSLAGYVIMTILLDKGFAPTVCVAIALACTTFLSYALHILIEAPAMRFERFLRKGSTPPVLPVPPQSPAQP